MINRQMVLKSHPQGVPKPDDFELVSGEIPVPGEGEMLVQNLYFSLEAAIRGWLDGKANYFEPIPLGGAIRGPSVAKVVKSNLAGFEPGEIIFGLHHWEDYSLSDANTILLSKLNPREGFPLSYYSGGLGGSGQTAYVGLHEIGQIKAGETVLVSAAAGATGSMACQIAKLRGCRVVGVVGSDDKATLVTETLGADAAVNYKTTPDLVAAIMEACPEGVDVYYDNVGGSDDKATLVTETLGADAAVNYKTTPDLVAAIMEACPEGVDVYYDNVGGTTLDAALQCMNTFGRVIGCGMISDYNNQENPTPIYNMWKLVEKELTMKGFLLYTYMDCVPAAMDQLHSWVADGKITVLENITEGLPNAGVAYSEMMRGSTIGKNLVKVDLQA